MAAQQSTPKVVQQRGRYFDELEIGTVFKHAPGRTVTEADNVLFTLSTLVGASVAQLTQGTIVANLGFESVNFPHPLYHGDTLYSESEILAKRESASRPGQGIVTVKHTGRNQDGTVVAECTRKVMLWIKDAHQRDDGRLS